MAALGSSHLAVKCVVKTNSKGGYAECSARTPAPKERHILARHVSAGSECSATYAPQGTTAVRAHTRKYARRSN